MQTINSILTIFSEHFLLKNKVNYTDLNVELVNGCIQTTINIQYDKFKKEDLDRIEANFSNTMGKLGYPQTGYFSKVIPPREDKIVLRHCMVFDFPISKRVTRPSLKILLGIQ